MRTNLLDIIVSPLQESSAQLHCKNVV